LISPDNSQLELSSVNDIIVKPHHEFFEKFFKKTPLEQPPKLPCGESSPKEIRGHTT
jgi:hypothetical protein